jgi:hypothetical protein
MLSPNTPTSRLRLYAAAWTAAVAKVRPTATEKKMFGGLAFMLNGNMFCGMTQDVLMARVGPKHYEAALAKPHVRVMDFTGRVMKGYVYVDPAGMASDEELQYRPGIPASLPVCGSVQRNNLDPDRYSYQSNVGRSSTAGPAVSKSRYRQFRQRAS